jgi:hypothetical protein
MCELKLFDCDGDKFSNLYARVELFMYMNIDAIKLMFTIKMFYKIKEFLCCIFKVMHF